tara:strand:- start:612 stop:1220 length:609 start_codon:yes stop_codon:yes gene_type:complete
MKALSLSVLLFIASTANTEQATSLLIYGDSISAGYGMDKDKQWSESLKVLLQENDLNLTVHNRSVSGETTGGGLTRINKILDEVKPSHILIELGGNDALRGYPPKKIYENLIQMIEAAETKGIEVFLMQIRILPNYGKRYQAQFESIYTQAAEEKDLKLIPFMLEDIALNSELMLQDGIHPNADAQPLIAKYVFSHLRSHLE